MMAWRPRDGVLVRATCRVLQYKSDGNRVLGLSWHLRFRQMFYEFGHETQSIETGSIVRSIVSSWHGRCSWRYGLLGHKPNPKYHPHVRKCSTYGQEDAWLNRVNRQRHGAHCARGVSLVDLWPTKSLRPTYGRNGHVVRHPGSVVALFCNSHLLCRTVETLSWCRFVVLLRRTGFLIEIEGFPICPDRQVRGRMGQPSLLLDLPGCDGRRHRAPGRISCRTTVPVHF